MNARQALIRTRQCAATLLLGLTALTCHANEAWPTKPIRIVVGYPAGSSPDVQARLIAEPLARELGQAVVVDNKPGASSNIGDRQWAADEFQVSVRQVAL